MPFEVAKILLQVQWIPKDCIEGENLGADADDADDDAEKDDSVRVDNLSISR